MFLKSLWEPNNVYLNYTFGLVKDPDGVLRNSYGDFIVLINNKNAVNPTYPELIEFLKRDKTDAYPYIYTHSIGGSDYGSAESHVNTTKIKEIIDKKTEMNLPRVCADFAEVLHNKAELENIRCGYVSIELEDYTDPNNLGIPSNTGHTLVVFNTTDRGLVFIDDTGAIDGPSNCDKIINNFKVGNLYIPESLFP